MNESKRRVVHGTLRSERAPLTTESEVHTSIGSSLGVGLLRLVEDFHVELTFLSAPFVLWFGLDQVSDIAATVGTPLVIAVALAHERSRRFLRRKLRHARLRRQWDRAARFSGLATANDHVPHVRRIEDVPAGERLSVRIPSGSDVEALGSSLSRLATCLEVREVQVVPDKTNARFATVNVVRRDPLSESDPLPWPNLHVESISMWDPIPVGVNEFGEIGFVTLSGRNILVGGEPHGGKSVGMSQIVATAALDPECELTLFDGKQVEFALWRHAAETVVGPDFDQAIATLQLLQVEMDRRYGELLSANKRKLERGGSIRQHVVAVDELAFYLTMGERKQNQEFERRLRDLVSRGRAAGIIVVAGTQRPSHDIIPTSLRDLFAFRWAMRCTTPQSSDTILGSGWASQGFSAHTIDSGFPGVGFLRHEGAEPVRLRSFFLNDDDIAMLAHRAAASVPQRPALSPVA